MKRILIIILLFFSLCHPSYLIADGPPPPPGGTTGDGSTNTGGNANGAPIDGGLGILLAMGIAYGGRKLYKARKEKEAAEIKS